MKKCFWTEKKARLQLFNSSPGDNLNWIFLPGGPGLGSESLQPLIKILHLPGRTWQLDLPNDGSNIISDDHDAFSSWFDALVEAVDALDNVILVAHSTGGMYALATKALKTKLRGLILMDSAPDHSWKTHFADYVNKHPIKDMGELHEAYTRTPSNELLKQMTLLSVPYLFTEEGLKKDVSFLENLPYNFKSCEWSDKNFDNTYQSSWIPNNIPTLIFSGEKDVITPIELFEKNKSYNHDLITIKRITNAGHFPWIERPDAVMDCFSQYIHQL